MVSIFKFYDFFKLWGKQIMATNSIQTMNVKAFHNHFLINIVLIECNLVLIVALLNKYSCITYFNIYIFTQRNI